MPWLRLASFRTSQSPAPPVKIDLDLVSQTYSYILAWRLGYASVVPIKGEMYASPTLEEENAYGSPERISEAVPLRTLYHMR